MNNDSSMLELLCSDSANNSSFLRLFRPNGFAQAGKAERQWLGLEHYVGGHAGILLEIWAYVPSGALRSSLPCVYRPVSEGKTRKHSGLCSKLKKKKYGFKGLLKCILNIKGLIIKLKKFEKSWNLTRSTFVSTVDQHSLRVKQYIPFFQGSIFNISDLTTCHFLFIASKAVGI